jgi:hypothetical protein
MKMILAALLFVFSSFAFANAETLIFSCSPIEDRKGVVAVEINQVDDAYIMSIFTGNGTGVRIEELNLMRFSKDEYFHSYSSPEVGSSLKIHIINGKPRKDMWYVAQLLNKKYDILFNCQYKL